LVEPGAEVSFAVRYRMAVGGEGWVFDLSCSPTGGCGSPVGRVEVRQGSGVRPFILAWNGQGPRDPAVYMNGVVEASACSDGMTLADVGVPEASTHDGDDLVIRWRPPERFLSASTEARLMAWTDGRAEPPCLMEILGNGSYECRLHPSVGAELFFTIAFSGPLVPGGTGYAFDQSTSSTGGCLGRYPGCGADVGTVYVGKYASDVPFTRVWNGHGPADPPLYLNARIAHVP
jgi:hypothetical protein